MYNFYFNKFGKYPVVIELPIQKTSIDALNKLADMQNADYIVFFSNIHSAKKRGLPILKLTTSLYSKKDNKIIISKKTEGDTYSRGDMWSCGSTTLSCLLIQSVRTSTNVILPVILKRQILK